MVAESGAVIDDSLGAAPLLPAWWPADLFRSRFSATRAYWVLALLASLAAALALAAVFARAPVPPGGDPGTWVATSYAFIGQAYPAQLTPLAYPPVLFPVLGLATLVSGGPIGGVRLVASGLMFALGLSTAWLAASLLRSRTVALVTVVFLLADPAILAMFFWGAYPNLLGFVFLNLALVGLLRAGQGSATSGALQFWAAFALAALTHSLVGVVLALTVALFLVLSWWVPLPARETMVDRARTGELEAPGIGARALFHSAGGRVGLFAFLVLVLGYYAFTAVSGIPHPDYVASSAVGFHYVSMGAVFEAILPTFTEHAAVVFYSLVVAAFGALGLYAVVRDRRPGWLTTPAVLLIAWPLSVILLVIGGYLLRILTDYHRFGFFLVVPLGLILAYLLERAWVAHPPPEGRPRGSRETGSGWRASARGPRPHSRRRPTIVAGAAAVLLVVVLLTTTVPAVNRDETIFTRVGHDQQFLDAIGAIRAAGPGGSILTVPGADKWAAALTRDNAFAPYADVAYLFYPSQETDSELSYWALTSHYVVTDGLVATSIHGVAPSQDTGVPDYTSFVAGSPRPVLRVAPPALDAVVYDPTTSTSAVVAATGTPTVTLPSQVGGAMLIEFHEPSVRIEVSAVVIAGLPDATLTVSAFAPAPYRVVRVDLALSPPVGAGATAALEPVAGEFIWHVQGAGQQPPSFGNVSPASGLAGVSNFDPVTGGPAVLLSFGTGVASGAASVSGSVVLRTPGASTFLPGAARVLSTPGIWADLGARFILMRSSSYAPNPVVALPDEIPYLAAEYGLPVLYQNTEWTVLEIPVSSAAAGGMPGAGGGAAAR